MNVLVLDVGTSSMRGTVINSSGEVMDQTRVSYRPDYAVDGAVEQSPEDWEYSMAGICSAAARKYRIEAVALTAQRSSVIPTDAEGKPLSRAIMWQDSRNRELCDRLRRQETDIHARCGSFVNTVYSGPKMSWLREQRKDVYRAAAHLPVIADYLFYQLCGEFVTDDTYASRSLMMDLEKRTWDDWLIELLGVNREKLSRICPVGSVVGTVTAAWAVRTGLRANIPVVSCGGDQQCAALGQGACEVGSATINLGTGGYLIAVTDTLPELRELRLNCNTYAIPGTYMLEYSLLTCGAAIDWAQELLYGGKDPERLNEVLLATKPGAAGVTVQPWFQGQSGIVWNSEARAAIGGLSLSTTRDDILRGIAEGICREFAAGLRDIERIQPISRVSVGGGLSNSDALCQLLADWLERPIVRSAHPEVTTVGAWASAMVCLGAAPDWKTAIRMAGTDGEKIFSPALPGNPHKKHP